MSSARISRRDVMAGAALTAASTGLAMPESAASQTRPIRFGMPQETGATPHICLNQSVRTIEQSAVNRHLQIGVTHCILRDMPFPFDTATLREKVTDLRQRGLRVGDLPIPWLGEYAPPMQEIIFAGPGRDDAIEGVKRSIHAAGKADIPVMEYNFYAHRLVEGYFPHPDPTRGNAGILSFDYEKVRDLPPLPNEGVHSADELWRNLIYFLKKVVPVAEQSNVRLALHPNDPPAPVSRGSQQIMATLNDWKRLIETVPSRANGIIFDCGVTGEIGEDPVAVCRYFASRDRIGHVHFRNVIVRRPSVDYTETTPDAGEVNMFAVMSELVSSGYKYMIFPEHARGLDVDREYKLDDYAAYALHVGYTKAMLQTALLKMR